MKYKPNQTRKSKIIFFLFINIWMFFHIPIISLHLFFYEIKNYYTIMFYVFVINTSSIRYFKLWIYVFICMLSNSAFWKSCISQYFFIPLCAENYLRAFGAKMRRKDGREGSQSWIVFPFSVFCRVVSCPLLDLRRQLWMWVLRSHWLSGWECCALIGGLHELLLEDCNWVWQHET